MHYLSGYLEKMVEYAGRKVACGKEAQGLQTVVLDVRSDFGFFHLEL